jgi:hypothetical protein
VTVFAASVIASIVGNFATNALTWSDRVSAHARQHDVAPSSLAVIGEEQSPPPQWLQLRRGITR